MSDKLFKLPLFAKTSQIKELPGQERGRVFMVTDAIRPQPDKGMGYLVEQAGGRKVKIHAWLALGGAVFSTDEPLTARPDRKPDGGMSKDEAGDIFFFIRSDGKAGKTVHFTQRERDGRFTVSESLRDMGPYAKGAYDIDEMAAACFVLYRVLPAERGDTSPMVTVGDILDGLLEAPYPDALDALLYRGAREGASGFERYAARSLEEAGAEYIRPIAATHGVDIRRLSSTGLFWTAYSTDGMVDREIDTLQSVEGALNRLVYLEHYLGEGSSPMIGALSEEVCEHAAMASLHSFAAGTGHLVHESEKHSDYLKVAGAEAARGGEWDLRTRFAVHTERLRAPFGFGYDYDCDARAGVFAIEATVPAATAFPAPEGERARNDARSRYALRLAMALAAAAFGSGVGVVSVVVTMRERSLDGIPVVSLSFKRRDFTMGVVPRIQDGSILDGALSLEALIERLSLRTLHMEMGEDGALLPIEPIDAGLPERISKMEGDTRPLPAELAEWLHADTVADLDIFDTSDDPLRDRYLEVVEQAREGDPQLGTQLADMVATYDAAEALQDSDARPLYCANMVSRVAAGLVGERGRGARFRKIPDTAFDARSTLCRFYRERGNSEDAIRLGEELIELAPTTFSAYHSHAVSCHEAGRSEDAIRSLVEGLRSAADPTDIACAYYRLGYYFWQGGDPSLGLACYTLVRPNSFFFGEAQSEMDELMREAHLSQRPSRDEAMALLRAEGVPIAPTSQLVELSARAAVGLVDAGLFNAAAPLVHFLSSVDVGPNSYDVIPSVVRSLRD